MIHSKCMVRNFDPEEHFLLFTLVSLIVAFLSEPFIEFLFEKILKIEIISIYGFILSYLIVLIFVRCSITMGYIIVGEQVLDKDFEPKRGRYLGPSDFFIMISSIVTAFSVDNLILLLNSILKETIPFDTLVKIVIGIPSIIILFYSGYYINEWLSEHKIIPSY